ncbi:hypothetical protein [Paenisporosarcina antarctica]|uniref:Uncharacterized protein n=1 Tax=Paenisporosarcina antarctica TaxID=417367 RepID=A0A4P7A4W7_9BACL|nr:hypothetical protein [Paenisporosarcina antarctica]QBP43196.1 hypothetical protein E2636_18760 [Paenisporosarcina antarctica]
MFILIILGISALLIVFGFAYDYFIRKSFKEAKRGPASQSEERAKLDAATNQAVNSTNIP